MAATAGAGPVLPRTISSAGSSTGPFRAGAPRRTSTSRPTATSPASAMGRLTVVRRGVIIEASAVSSNPTMLSRAGTGTPRSVSRLTTPAATSSL